LSRAAFAPAAHQPENPRGPEIPVAPHQFKSRLSGQAKQKLGKQKAEMGNGATGQRATDSGTEAGEGRIPVQEALFRLQAGRVGGKHSQRKAATASAFW
jgi:hypothetical protein